MLTSIVVLAPLGAYWDDLEIKLTPGAGEPLVLLGITGLEPVSANVSTQAMSSVDGEIHIGSQVGKRNIVAKLGLLTPEARELAYFYFLPKNKFRLRLNFNHRDSVEIDCVVENTPELDRFTEAAAFPAMQVSLICPKPNFHSELLVVNGVTGQTQETAPETDLLYSGTSGGGFFLALNIGDAEYTGGITILSHVVDTTSYRTMEFLPYTYLEDWQVRVNTHLGDRRAEVHPPEGSEEDLVSILGYMEDTYFWTQLFAAMNKIQVVTPESATPRTWALWYTDQFAGV